MKGGKPRKDISSEERVTKKERKPPTVTKSVNRRFMSPIETLKIERDSTDKKSKDHFQ